MHPSRFSTLLIDVPAPDAGRAAGFWSSALGSAAEPEAGEPRFTGLPGAFPGLVVAVQALEEGGARFHVDVETDDVDAETSRLRVIPRHSPDEEFAAHARVWA